jgi:hypothetical protein
VTAQFKLSLLRCDPSDPLADFFDARATLDCRGVSAQTSFIVAGRDLTAFVSDAARAQRGSGKPALLLGGWDAERSLRLVLVPARLSDTFETRVCMVSQTSQADPERIESEFNAPSDAVSAFLKEIQHLVDRRELGDATLNGDADAA